HGPGVSQREALNVDIEVKDVDDEGRNRRVRPADTVTSRTQIDKQTYLFPYTPTSPTSALCFRRMTRAQRLYLFTTVFTAIYLLIFFQILAVPLVDDDTVQKILPVLPWWILVSFGSYSLWSLGWGLFTYRDCPEAYAELLGDLYTRKLLKQRMICVCGASRLIDTV
ncbi:hypothetical protein Hypma_006015, partial [Hypsizygus marmoreus]